MVMIPSQSKDLIIQMYLKRKNNYDTAIISKILKNGSEYKWEFEKIHTITISDNIEIFRHSKEIWTELKNYWIKIPLQVFLLWATVLHRVY